MHKTITQHLAEIARGKDIRLYVGHMNEGLWIWNNETQVHEHITRYVLNWRYGFTKEEAIEFAHACDKIEIAVNDLKL